MAYIEGVGNDVLLVIAVLFLICCIVIAWATTYRTSELELRITEIAALEWSHFRNGILRIIAWLRNLRHVANQPASPAASQQTVDDPDSSSDSGETDVDTAENCEESSEARRGTVETTGAYSSQRENVSSEDLPTSARQVETARDCLAEGDSADGETPEHTKTDEKRNSQEKVKTESASSQQSQEFLQEGHPPINVRLRYLDETQRLVQTHPDETVGDFKKKNFATELAQNYIIRLIFNGQELRRDNLTLRSHNIQDNCVVHCLLSVSRAAEQNTPASNQQQGAPAEFNLSNWMMPLFGLILGILWMLRFRYRFAFTTSTTLSLIGITFCYIVYLLASLRRRTTPQSHEHVD